MQAVENYVTVNYQFYKMKVRSQENVSHTVKATSSRWDQILLVKLVAVRRHRQSPAMHSKCITGQAQVHHRRCGGCISMDVSQPANVQRWGRRSKTCTPPSPPGRLLQAQGSSLYEIEFLHRIKVGAPDPHLSPLLNPALGLLSSTPLLHCSPFLNPALLCT